MPTVSALKSSPSLKSSCSGSLSARAKAQLITRPNKKRKCENHRARLLHNMPNSQRFLMNLACGMLEKHIGEHPGIGCNWLMRTEANAGVEGTIEVQIDRGPKLVH